MNYRNMSTSTLRVFEALLDRPGWRRMLGRQLSDIQHELLARDLSSLAESNDGFPVAKVEGWQ